MGGVREPLTKGGGVYSEEFSQLGEVGALKPTAEKQMPLCGGRAEEGKRGGERSVECDPGVSITGNQVIGGSQGSCSGRGHFGARSHLFV